MSVRETDPAGSESIDVRRVNQTTIPAVTLHITNPQIIREDENYVGPHLSVASFRRWTRRCVEGRKQEDRKQS
ncbi:MAG: hypothetical protein ACJASX_000373 [Limisphaerales bacterium]|jgi:hypothetical protein